MNAVPGARAPRCVLLRVLAAGALLSSLGGCSSFGDISGAVAGVATGALTANPALGAGVAIGVSAAADAAGKAFFRHWHGAEQDSIAAVIGTLEPDRLERWEIRHPVPYGNAHGWLRVTRVIDTPLARCKEALFSVDDDAARQRAWFLTTACEQGGRWKWAAAEPAVPRWGNLQ